MIGGDRQDGQLHPRSPMERSVPLQVRPRKRIRRTESFFRQGNHAEDSPFLDAR